MHLDLQQKPTLCIFKLLIIKIKYIMHKSTVFLVLFSTGISLISCGSTQTDTQIPPDKKITMNINNMAVTIDGKVGARIISLKLDTQEMLSSNKVNRGNYGSTLWTGPEAKWRGHGILDTSAFTVKSFAGSDLELKSRNDTILGFAFTKKFHASLADTSLVINYTITNISKDTIGVAPWEVTRVITGGLAMFPKASPQDLPTVNGRYPLLKIQDSIGIIWYPYDTSKVAAQKLFMYGGEGWAAYIKDGALFIKKFPSIKPAQAAPGEKNVEAYVSKPKNYLELENQGVYQVLKSNESLTYEVKWYLRRLPKGIKAEIGNKAFINYIRKVIK